VFLAEFGVNLEKNGGFCGFFSRWVANTPLKLPLQPEFGV